MDRRLIELVRARARGCCEYCRMPQEFDDLPFQIDHIIAIKHGGSTSIENLALSCYLDNHHKGPNIAGYDLATRRVARLFDPRRDRWPRHFRWEGARLIGRTPVGRVTVDVLRINLATRVELRASLMDEGVFP